MAGNYGYAHSARVIGADAGTGGFYLESVALARTSKWGPVVSCVPGVEVGDRVVLISTGTSRDNLVIIGKMGDQFPEIPDIEGLQEALDALQDDIDLRALLTDPRFTDARTPTAHAASHAVAGSDPLTPAAIGALASALRGAANGVASLGADTKVPFAELPTGAGSANVAVGNHTHDLIPIVCTSGTRPSSPSLGQIIFEDDTDYLWVWRGVWQFISGPERHWRWDRTTTSCTSGLDTLIAWTSRTTVAATENSSSRLTPGAGRFQVEVSLRYPSGGTGGTEAFAGVRRYNSSNVLQEVAALSFGSTSGGGATGHFSGEMVCAAGDYLEVWAFQASGVAKTPEDGPFVNNGYTKFQGRFLRPD